VDLVYVRITLAVVADKIQTQIMEMVSLNLMYPVKQMVVDYIVFMILDVDYALNLPLELLMLETDLFVLVLLILKMLVMMKNVA
jgi:hypothetical protein